MPLKMNRWTGILTYLVYVMAFTTNVSRVHHDPWQKSDESDDEIRNIFSNFENL